MTTAPPSDIVNADAYASLFAAIRDQTIRPGARINELEWSRTLAISRTPLREALSRLAAEGFVTVRPNQGFFARELSLRTASSLYEARRIIELAALDLTVTKAEAADVEAFADRWRAIWSQPTRDAQLLLEQDEAFHLELATLSGNHELVVQLERIHAHIHALRRVAWEELQAMARQEHLAIVEALLERRRSEGVRALTAHLTIDPERLAKLLRAVSGSDQETPPYPAASAKKPARAAAAEPVAERIYRLVKTQLVSFQLRPGERLKEQELAHTMGTSRASVREALSRLVAERLLTFRPNHGFALRMLDPKEVFELYEMRAGLEARMVILAIERASADELAAFGKAWDDALQRMPTAEGRDKVLEDEAFHRRVAVMARNEILIDELNRINDRIHFVRGMDLRQQDDQWQEEHTRIVAAIVNRDTIGASTLMKAHISRLMDEIRAVLKLGVAELYIHG